MVMMMMMMTYANSFFTCSMEFLMGRSLRNAVANLNLEDTYKSAVDQLGYKWENLVEEERDAALGNGGLGKHAGV